MVVNYVMALKTELNLSAHYRKDIIDLLTKFGLRYNFKDVTRDDVAFLDSFRKPETVDPLHKWIGTYNIYRVHLIRFFKWFYAPYIERTKRPKPAVVDNIPELKRKEKSIYKPSDLWTPEDDLLFLKVSDTANANIQKFDSQGNFLLKWGSKGSKEGQLKRPAGIETDASDNVYVTDAGNDRIQKFDSKGKFIAVWGSKGSDEGMLDSPHDIAVDSSGNVYVAEQGNYRIQKFDSEGNFRTSWGSAGTGDDQFLDPHSLAVYSN
jgi:NHL repeat